MTHDTMRERIALRLYSELDAGELRELEEHLTTCEECRRFATELEDTLAPHVSASESAPDLAFPGPVLRDIEEPTRTRVAHPLAAAALLVAGFVLGVLVTQMTAGDASPGPSEVLSSRFERAEAPPAATTTGPLGALAGMRR